MSRDSSAVRASILLVEDDADLRAGLVFALDQEGHRVTAVSTIGEAESAVDETRFDLIILDVMLPDGSGFDFCRGLRKGGRRSATAADAPVLFLTARDDEIDVVRGLDIGADDYVTKPFRLRELLSRVYARLRRDAVAPREPSHVLSFGDVSVDTRRAEVRKRNRLVALTASEYRLFLALAENAGQTLTRGRLADRLVGMSDAVVDDNTVSVYVRRLREKLEDDPTAPQLIRTVRGIGYRLEAAQ